MDFLCQLNMQKKAKPLQEEMHVVPNTVFRSKEKEKKKRKGKRKEFLKVVISKGKVLYEDMVTAFLFLLSLLCRYLSFDKPTLSHKKR